MKLNFFFAGTGKQQRKERRSWKKSQLPSTLDARTKGLKNQNGRSAALNREREKETGRKREREREKEITNAS